MEKYTIGGMLTDASQIEALFKHDDESQENQEKSTDTDINQPKDTEEENITETVDPLDLFKGTQESEKVGNEDTDTEEKKEPSSKTETGSSPKNNPYSSIAYAMLEEGVLSNLTEEDLKDVKDPESIVAIMDKQLEARYDEQQRRVLDALDAGVDKNIVRQYEDTIKALDNVSIESIEEENEQGENLRKAIIYRYYIDKGESQDRATKMVERALSGGTDIEDAKDFIEELRESTKNKYKALIEENKKQIQTYKKQQEEKLAKAKKSILEDENVLGNISIDKATRQKALDYWLKPTHKKEDGTYQSELQRYAEENPDDFQIKLALLFAMSDKFKNLENIAKDTVKKEKKKAMSELEKVINNTQRTDTGALNLGYRDEDSNFGFELASPDKWNR